MAIATMKNKYAKVKNCWKQGLAVTLSASLILTTGNFAAVKATPAAAPELAPPVSLGYLTDSFNLAPIGHSSKLVILIHDLHARYGVEKNIAVILEFLTTSLS